MPADIDMEYFEHRCQVLEKDATSLHICRQGWRWEEYFWPQDGNPESDWV